MVSIPKAVVVLTKRGTEADGGEFEGGALYMGEKGDQGGIEAPEEVDVSIRDVVVFASSLLVGGQHVFHGMREATRGRRVAIGLVFQLREDKKANNKANAERRAEGRAEGKCEAKDSRAKTASRKDSKKQQTRTEQRLRAYGENGGLLPVHTGCSKEAEDGVKDGMN